MSLNEEVELLRGIPLFAGIEPSKLKLLAFASERLTFEAGASLFREGDVGDAAFVIIEGEVEVTKQAPRGPIVLARLGRNSLVGEIAIIRDVTRTATVTAVARTVALRIVKDLFFRLLNEFPQMGMAVMRELAHRVEEANKTAQALAAAAAR